MLLANTEAFYALATMTVPKKSVDQEAVFEARDARKTSEDKLAFMSAEELEQRENSKFSEDEKVYIYLKRQQQIVYDMEQSLNLVSFV